jgi:site-specific recombinase XerD
MQRSTFKVLFYLKRDKVKTNGTIPLFSRITVDGQEVRFSMKCDINPKYWDVKTGKATGRTLDAVKINALIDDTRAAIYKVYREMQERDNYVTAEKIKNIFLGLEQKHQTLLEIFDYHNSERKFMIGVNLNQATYSYYVKLRKQIADFLLYKYNLHDIPVKEVNHVFIAEFEAYLQTTYNYRRNTVVSVLKRLRHIFEVAISREWIYKNPFREYNLQWQKVDRGFLTQEEIDRLIDFPFERKPLEKARDIFIFCTFTGLSYSDVKHLTYDNIQSAFEGKLWVRGKRRKTDVEYNIPLLNIPKMILDKYRGTTNDNLALPVYHSIIYNKLLKEVAKECGIEKRMSSHLARHTFATLALTKGVSIESVSKMLGHSNINTTQIYAKITNKKVGSEMAEFAGKMKKLDAKLQFAPAQEEIGTDKIIKSLKIPTGRAADIIWENLIAKVWDKLSNIERQSFVSEIESTDVKPTTLRDFYLTLMDYFLDSLKTESNDSDSIENTYADMETKFAVNF